MAGFVLRTDEFYRKWYNRRKKPWRSATFIHKALGRRNCLLRIGLGGMLAAELMVIGVTEPDVIGNAARILGAGWESSRTVETMDTGDREVTPSDRSDSGITIDLKEGKVEFWRTDQSVRSENGETE